MEEPLVVEEALVDNSDKTLETLKIIRVGHSVKGDHHGNYHSIVHQAEGQTDLRRFDARIGSVVAQEKVPPYLLVQEKYRSTTKSLFNTFGPSLVQRKGRELLKTLPRIGGKRRGSSTHSRRSSEDDILDTSEVNSQKVRRSEAHYRPQRAKQVYFDDQNVQGGDLEVGGTKIIFGRLHPRCHPGPQGLVSPPVPSQDVKEANSLEVWSGGLRSRWTS